MSFITSFFKTMKLTKEEDIYNSHRRKCNWALNKLTKNSSPFLQLWWLYISFYTYLHRLFPKIYRCMYADEFHWFRLWRDNNHHYNKSITIYYCSDRRKEINHSETKKNKYGCFFPTHPSTAEWKSNCLWRPSICGCNECR